MEATLELRLLVYSYLGFFVIGVVPVVHRASLQGEISAMPHPKSTDQFKLCLGIKTTAKDT